MKIVRMDVSTFWKGEVGVKGLIEDRGLEYQTSIYVKSGQIRDYSCSCAEGNSYKGACAHGKALLAYYQAEEDSKSTVPTFTSQEVRTMIREYTNREVAQILGENKEEQVAVVPRLLVKRGELKLSLKVKRTREYLVKDLLSFGRSVEAGSYVEYGQNLAFHHNLEVFTPESRPLVSFVQELAESYEKHYRQFGRSSSETLLPVRELDLSKADRDRFFEMVMNTVIEAEDYRGGKGKLLICEDNPRFHVDVRKKGRDGIRVVLRESMIHFSGEKYLYFLDGNKLLQCDEAYSRTLQVFIDQMSTQNGEVVLNEKDMPLFAERVLKKIEGCTIIEYTNLDLKDYEPEPLKAKFVFDSKGVHHISMVPELSYGDYSFHPVEDEKVPRTICRDIPGEFRISQLITRYFKVKAEEGGLVIQDDEDSLYRLLLFGMEEFKAAGQVYISETVRQWKVLPSPEVKVGVSVTSGWLDLNIDTGDLSRSDFTKILAAYQQKKKYYRLKNGEFMRLDGAGLEAVARMSDSLALTGADIQKNHIMLPSYRAFYLDRLFKEEGKISFYRDQLFKAVVRGIKSVEDSDFQVPKSLEKTLRGYQKFGFRWLKTLDSFGFGGILADDMGLGKTIQVISLLVDEYKEDGQKRKPSLIICPASLIYNWDHEIAAFGSSLKAAAIAGNAQEREAQLSHMEDWDVIITSYDLLRRDFKWYQDKEFRFQVIDEAQYIKNAGTQSSKSVKAVKAGTRFALTGTPVENRLSELWSIFDYLMPGFLLGSQQFRKKFEVPIVKEGNQEALRNLNRMIGPFILRRVKKDVLKELPDKLETVVYSRMEKEQKELYLANAGRLKGMLEGDMEKLQILAELMRLRQICCDPRLCYENYKAQSAKLETCMDLLKNGVEGGHKILLFSQFTSMLELISQRLKKEEIAHYMLTGATSKEDRLSMVNDFKKENTPVFLISLKAGGTGLNLTAADMVIHYDPWWNVAAQNQATDRAHRIGQEKQVTVVKLITENTIEENILKLQQMKQNLADQVITEGSVSLSSLTREDIIKML